MRIRLGIVMATLTIFMIGSSYFLNGESFSIRFLCKSFSCKLLYCDAQRIPATHAIHYPAMR